MFWDLSDYISLILDKWNILYIDKTKFVFVS